MANGKLWQLMQKDVEALMKESVFDLKELSMIIDYYYKTGMIDEEHNLNIAQHIIDKKYTPLDFTKELSLNETLRLFRGLFFMESVPSSFKFKPIFALYKDLIRHSGIEDKLTLSTWLTVIETCRHSQEGLSDLLLYSKEKLNE